MKPIESVKLREDFSLLDKITEGIEPRMYKVIGSYLYREDFKDIDIIVQDIMTGWKLKEAGKKNKVKVQIIFASSESEFNLFEEYLTFKNICFSYYCNAYKIGMNFVDSKELEFNNYSTEIFKNSKTVFDETKKMLARGYTIS